MHALMESMPEFNATKRWKQLFLSVSARTTKVNIAEMVHSPAKKKPLVWGHGGKKGQDQSDQSIVGSSSSRISFHNAMSAKNQNEGGKNIARYL